jgi:serine/threonine protein phosphatase 1
MRVLAIGDIHGCLTALTTLLDMVQPQADDTLIALGDYVDRGPESRGVLDLLIKIRSERGLIALRGNHDLMMLDARTDLAVRHDWLHFGGRATLQSYGVQVQEDENGILPFAIPGTLDDVPANHWQFLENDCVLWHETDTHFFVHATVIAELPLDKQPEHALLWDKLGNPQPHRSGKIMVCGHTAQKSGLPLDLRHTLCIDTFVYGDGWLTCVDVVSGQVWQANQGGERRQFRLDEFN